jgi:hypothetical protein
MSCLSGIGRQRLPHKNTSPLCTKVRQTLSSVGMGLRPAKPHEKLSGLHYYIF